MTECQLAANGATGAVSQPALLNVKAASKLDLEPVNASTGWVTK